MKEIITETTEPVFVTVQKGTKTKKIKQYQTEDGKIFDNKRDAELYEYDLEFKKIDYIRYEDFSELGEGWYRAKDEKEIEFLKKALGRPYSTSFGFGNIKVGEWFNYHYMDGGDYRDTIIITPLPEFERQFSELMNLLKNKE